MLSVRWFGHSKVALDFVQPARLQQSVDCILRIGCLVRELLVITEHTLGLVAWQLLLSALADRRRKDVIAPLNPLR